MGAKETKLEWVKAAGAVIVALVAIYALVSATGEFKGQVKSQGEMLARHESKISDNSKSIVALCDRTGALEGTMDRLVTGQNLILSRLIGIDSKLKEEQ